MRYYLAVILIVTLVLIGCSGKDKITVDKIKPLPPDLITHLGDLGDGVVTYNNQDILLNDDNNGIDAVPDGNWIKVSWAHFLDTDLDFYKIYRFDENNLIPQLIDTKSIDENDYYVDSSSNITTHVQYSYFIEVFDKAGNSAISDTVSYRLLDKPILVEPENASIVNPNSIVFKWNASGFVSKYRLLMFDENHDFIWKYDLDVAFEGDSLEVTGPANLSQLNPGAFIYWRIDSFEWDSELNFYIGAESNERILYLAD